MTTLTCTPVARTTKSLLGYGIIAGPLYVLVSLAQALTRPGFDLSKHAWSLLENGHLGWIQIANFALTGAMTIAAAMGLRRTAKSRTSESRAVESRAVIKGAWLIGAYGAGLLGAAVFRADPAAGFPVGTPEATTVSWHGVLHFMIGGVGFLGLIAACFVLAGHYARRGERGLAWFSRITGIVFLAGFAGIASGSHGPTTLAFVAAVLTVCAWLTTISIHAYKTV